MSKTLKTEDYTLYVKHPHAIHLKNAQLNRVINMHGFMTIKDSRRKILEALSLLDLMDPVRSTITDTLSPVHALPLTVDQVNEDLDLLQWRDDGFSAQSLQSLSFAEDNVNGSAPLLQSCAKRKRKRKRARKVKQREVFNPVYLTKPRSKKMVQKRKNLSEICIYAP